MLHHLNLGEPIRFESMGDAIAEWRVQLTQPPYDVHDGREAWFEAVTAGYDRMQLVDLLVLGHGWLAIPYPPSGFAPAWWEFARSELNYWLLYRAFRDCEDVDRCRAIWTAMLAERRIQRAACELELVRNGWR